MLKKGSTVLSIWCGINFILAFIILCYVIVLKQNSPILQVASFSEAEIASLSAKTIAALNCFTILYNSCSLMVSVLTWPLIRKNLVAGRKIGFLDVGVRDRLYRSDGISRFLIHWAWTLAGECCSERFIPCGHWLVGLFPIQRR